MAIVPTALALPGHRAWWLPKRLDRLLPHVDLEGEALTHRAADGVDADSDGHAGARADTPAGTRVYSTRLLPSCPR